MGVNSGIGQGHTTPARFQRQPPSAVCLTNLSQIYPKHSVKGHLHKQSHVYLILHMLIYCSNNHFKVTTTSLLNCLSLLLMNAKKEISSVGFLFE